MRRPTTMSTTKRCLKLRWALSQTRREIKYTSLESFVTNFLIESSTGLIVSFTNKRAAAAVVIIYLQPYGSSYQTRDDLNRDVSSFLVFRKRKILNNILAFTKEEDDGTANEINLRAKITNGLMSLMMIPRKTTDPPTSQRRENLTRRENFT